MRKEAALAQPKYCPGITWRAWGKSQKTPVRIAYVPVQIRTENFPKESLEFYHVPSCSVFKFHLIIFFHLSLRLPSGRSRRIVSDVSTRTGLPTGLQTMKLLISLGLWGTLQLGPLPLSYVRIFTALCSQTPLIYEEYTYWGVTPCSQVEVNRRTASIFKIWE
jgi:hypothetical protein